MLEVEEEIKKEKTEKSDGIDNDLLMKAYYKMCLVKNMAQIYDDNRQICKYVHSTSRGHEAIQLAVGFQLKEYDYLSPYYRDESIMLGLGFEPYELMLQLLAKGDDPFSGGRSYYNHPSVKKPGYPTIPHQSSATGMQAIPATGMAHGISYIESEKNLKGKSKNKPVVVCSLGDGSITEGEVSEAFQMAVLKKLPILYLIQDNKWGISAYADEMRAMDAYEFAAGFKGLKREKVDGSNFIKSYQKVRDIFEYIRKKRSPVLLHASVPLLGHHTSGVRKEWYRTEKDLTEHYKDDPIPKLRQVLVDLGIGEDEISKIENDAAEKAKSDFDKAVKAKDPAAETLFMYEFAETPVTEEKGEREPKGAEPVIMVDSALHAIDELMKKHPEAILYGQDVGRRLGGVFREAATLAQKYGDNRVFNTPIQEAYIVGSTAGMSAVGIKPIVEIQFADYSWAGMNQLVVELSKSCYLTCGKFPVSSIIRIPVGAYGGGGPYHSDCVESSYLPIRGIKIAYPSNSADMKGLMKAAFYDPNPVLMFEHKGLYWSKVPGTDAAKSIEPDENYIVPFGKARIFLKADDKKIESGESLVVVTYGMGVHWALNAAKNFPGHIEILDLRTLNPLDEEAIYESVRKHGKCLVLTEEQIMNSFAESLAGRIAKECFQYLDAPVEFMGSVNVPAVPLNMGLEKEMLPSAEKVAKFFNQLLGY
ncbi:MAG TPA: thiamine pyrophosphate-dependent enzyme [Ignavibacteria bacterium]|nr:thiamine pyrophosphate-dependent enzyme [Ignavibacteria bacterium]